MHKYIQTYHLQIKDCTFLCDALRVHRRLRPGVSIWAETRRRGFWPETPLLNLEGSNVSRDGRVGTRSPEITLYTRVWTRVMRRAVD
jgi:hypothetical protein